MLWTDRDAGIWVFDVWRKQDLVDLVVNPVDADVVAERHVSVVDEDVSLKTFNSLYSSWISWSCDSFLNIGQH